MHKYEEANIERVTTEIQDSIKRCIDSKKGLFLTGTTGTGKTYVCYAISNIGKGKDTWKPTVVHNFVELLIESRDAMSKGNYLDKIEQRCSEEKLIIDDIGAEKTSEHVIEFLYVLINNRYNSQKRTILTTNLDAGAFEERYGGRILSRIAEMCEVVELRGVDRRVEN